VLTNPAAGRSRSPGGYRVRLLSVDRAHRDGNGGLSIGFWH
jgi:hypothetical protein